nr:MaoC/PaaZ C-terminal domain-containing protein [Sphingomonas sp. CDS-1]
MPLDPNYLLRLPPRITTHRYTQRDTILYALGVGAGADPEDLHLVYENELQTLPTMAVVLAYPGFWQKEPQYGIDWTRVLHGEQSTVIHAPIPVEGEVRGELVVERIVDKGADKGALLVSRRDVFDATSDRHLATVRQVSFLRGDGGCGGSSAPLPAPHALPEREPDTVVALSTRPEQALIYRLSGDYNPLHADPAVAAEANLPRPILHGLCTYGIAGRAIVRALCGNNAGRMTRLDCRFTSPVYPGDTIAVAIWREGPGKAGFQAKATERNVIVLGNGYAEYEEV